MKYIQRLLKQICELNVAYERLLKANPNPVVAQNRADQAFEQIMLLLDNTEVAAQINQFLSVLSNTSQQRSEAAEYLRRNLAAFIRTEIELTRPLPLRAKDIELVVDRFLKTTSEGTFLRDTSELRERLAIMHDLYSRKIAKSREQSRKAKKAIKAKSLSSVVEALSGVAVFAANGAAIGTQPTIWTSGLIGLTMFVRGLEKIQE